MARAVQRRRKTQQKTQKKIKKRAVVKHVVEERVAMVSVCGSCGKTVNPKVGCPPCKEKRAKELSDFCRNDRDTRVAAEKEQGTCLGLVISQDGTEMPYTIDLNKIDPKTVIVDGALCQIPHFPSVYEEKRIRYTVTASDFYAAPFRHTKHAHLKLNTRANNHLSQLGFKVDTMVCGTVVLAGPGQRTLLPKELETFGFTFRAKA